jgi:hypothetical protein
MVIISDQEYNQDSGKNDVGRPNEWWADKTLGLSTTGHPGNLDFYFSPRFENGDHVIVYRYVKIFDDMDAASNDVEFPQEWFLPLMVGLSWLLAPKHGLPLKERQVLFQEMTLLIMAAKDYDQEMGSMYLSPEESNG